MTLLFCLRKVQTFREKVIASRTIAHKRHYNLRPMYTWAIATVFTVVISKRLPDSHHSILNSQCQLFYMIKRLYL